MGDSDTCLCGELVVFSDVDALLCSTVIIVNEPRVSSFELLTFCIMLYL